MPANHARKVDALAPMHARAHARARGRHPSSHAPASARAQMPGFGESCEPRGACTFGARLSPEEVQALAEYVVAQADAGWPDGGAAASS